MIVVFKFRYYSSNDLILLYLLYLLILYQFMLFPILYDEIEFFFIPG